MAKRLTDEESLARRILGNAEFLADVFQLCPSSIERPMPSKNASALPKPRHTCPWDVNAAAVLDSSKRELAALPFLFIISYCRRCRPDLIACQHSRLSCWWQSCPRDHFFTRDRLCIGPVSCLAAVQKFKARFERVTSVIRGRSKVDVGGSHCSWQCAFIRRSTPNWRIDVSSIHLGEH